VAIDVPRIHAEEVRREQGGLVTTGAGANLDDRVAIIERVVRQEGRLQLRLELDELGLEAYDLAGGLGRHLGVVNGNELARLRELVFRPVQPRRQLDDGGESSVLPAKLGEPRVVASHRRLGQLPLDCRRTLQRFGEPIAQETVGRFAQAFFPNFWRKRSIRPAVSMNFCLPV